MSGAVRLLSLLGIRDLVDLEAADRPAGMAMDQTAHLLGAPRLHGLADQAADTETLAEDEIHLLRAGEQLRTDEQVRTNLARLVQHILGEMDGR